MQTSNAGVNVSLLSTATSSFEHGPACCAARRGIRGYGNVWSTVAFVGIAPGRREVERGRPFIGPAGALLNKALAAVKLRREDYYFTNCLCWWNNEPTPQEIDVCAPRLWRELSKAHLPNLRLVVTVGDIPTQYIVGKPIKECRGYVLWNEKLGAYVMPMYHPSAVLHGSTEIAYDIIRDLAKLPAITEEWSPTGQEGAVDWHVTFGVRDTEEWLATAARYHEVVALDIETGTADEDDPHGSAQLVCLSLSKTGDTALVVPRNIAEQVDWSVANAGQGIQWAAHFGQFDLQGMRRHLGVQLSLTHDTGLASYSIDERTTGIHGLDRLAAEYCGGEFYKSATQQLLARGLAARIDPNLLYERNARDAAYTRRLVDIFAPKQEADGVVGLYNDILIPAANMFADTQYEGVYIDQARARVLLRDWTARYAALEAQCIEQALAAGWLGKYRTKRNMLADIREPFNPRSPLQLSKLLYSKEYLGLRGGPSTDHANLLRLEGQHPIVDTMLLIRRLGQMLKHYLEPLPTFLRDDGKLHSVVFIHGTETGRPSYRKPPLQTIPHYVEDELARIRELFCAEDDDHVIAELDYAQLDIWMGAAYSQDEAMFRDLRSGDYHGSVTTRVFGLSKPTHLNDKEYADAWELRRQAAKVITFGNMFGTQAPALAARIHTTREVAQQYLDNFFTEYHDYRDWIENTKRNARRLGYIPTVSGRKRRFPLVVDTKQLNEAINAPIQGTESDYTLTSAIELHAWLKEAQASQHSRIPANTIGTAAEFLGPKGYDSRILFLVHDSIVMHVAKRYLNEVLLTAKAIMEKPRFEGFPSVPVDIKVGNNWYEAKKWTPPPSPIEAHQSQHG